MPYFLPSGSARRAIIQAARERNVEVKVITPGDNSDQRLTPSDLFLWAAFGSIAASLAFNVTGKRHAALFVGQWAPTFLLLGIYNKLVKLHGSEGV